MELQIQDLISSIKHEGITKAEEESAKIISEAQSKASEIVASAKAEAEKVLEDAKKEIEVLRQSAKVGAQQALRDAELSFKKEVENQVKKILKDSVRKSMDDASLAKLIAAVVSDQDVSKLSAEVASVSESLKGLLADMLSKGLEIKPVKGISAGFRISSKDGSGFFDCTDEEIAQMLAPFVGELKF